ncbi:MAG: carboxylating nicotinate-nucleotide diphosphorylase [Actinomycetota bacterium]
MTSLDPRTVAALVDAWLTEDVGRGDRTTQAVVPEDLEGRARIEAREETVVAGLNVAAEVFRQLGGESIKWLPEVADGTRVGAGGVLARIEGPLRAILTGERTALNILQRLCGVATATAEVVTLVADTGVRIVDTRKTTPGLRVLEKYAVAVGGGHNHRAGLDDGILVKDNHILAAGGVGEATRRAVSEAPHGLVVEVEVTDLDGLREALDNGASAVLLDNMTPDEIRRAVQENAGRALLEASGGITRENIRSYAETGVDLISLGALTHSAPAVDLALEVEN